MEFAAEELVEVIASTREKKEAASCRNSPRCIREDGSYTMWNNMKRLTHKGARDLDYIGWDYQLVLYKETPIRS
jgi:hypothetical protein